MTSPQEERMVWKFDLCALSEPAYQIVRKTLEVPVGAKVLELNSQDSRICLWFEVNPDVETQPREFTIYGTGHGIEPGAGYVGTVHNSPFVWHCYELPVPFDRSDD